MGKGQPLAGKGSKSLSTHPLATAKRAGAGEPLADAKSAGDAPASAKRAGDAPVNAADAGEREPHARAESAGAPAGGLAHGTVLHGKFRVLELRRSSAEELCYKALHLGTGRNVELRLLPEGVSARSKEAGRMLRAARAAGRAPHAHLLNVVDSGLDPEQRPFVIYEQFAGVPCSELIAQRGPCELRLAADILTQVLDGLSALHARGVYHRQLRPESVLVDGSAEEVRVKLAGLGYSALREQSAERPNLPRGYSRYLAPEARRGEESASVAVDVYAAGVLLRYLLTGDTAHDAPLEPAVERVVARATAEEPDERFQSAEQFRACLSAIAGPTTRESLIPSGGLLSDLRFMLQRREALDEGAPPREGEHGLLELYPVLLMVESLYARVGPVGWGALLAEVPELEQLLPAAGRGAHYRSQGVPARLVSEMLRHADRLSGRGNLKLVVELGEELARRGLDRLCASLPARLTAESLVACVPVIWRTLAREGEIVALDRQDAGARLALREQRGASLELSALFAGLLRAELRRLSPLGEVNLVAAHALADAADIYALVW